MRIGLDARTIYATERRGIGKSLLRLYRELSLVRPDWEVFAYHRSADPEPELLPPDFATPRCIDIPGDRFDAWQRLRLPTAAWRDACDVLHCPANSCPGWTPLPTVVTIHDLIPLDLPETVADDDVRRFERGLTAAGRRAAAIFCPSEYTALRLVDGLLIEPDRVHVTPWGADRAAPLSDDRVAETTDRYRVDRPFVLHYGAADPRKNTRRLIEAWSMMGARQRKRWTLLIIGLDAEAQAEYLSLCDSLGVTASVMLHGFAPEGDIPALLQAAEVLAYPSRSEGFGMPILEAFAANTAVLAGSETSLPEVAGDAAVAVDPEDTASVCNGLRTLLGDTAYRDELRLRGQMRLHLFSWDACARRFAEAIESAAPRQPRRRLVAA